MKTVYVGLSGGVDSSVTAALLQKQGYNVVGVYMQNWTADVGGVECPWRADLTDAKAVAAKLGVPFKVFDFQKQYRSRVVDVMVAEYAAGRTPNPDVLCNQDIKFKLFLDAALADGADLIATGHYARTKEGQLLAGIDANKDQSYFLYRVTGEALQKSLMPIGELTKPQVRKLAAELGLPTAAKPDSQGICFVGEVGIKPFLSQYIDSKPGPIVRASDGATIGKHDGAVFYTIGQRHGLGVGGGQPYYVISKDIASNTVYVTDDQEDLGLYTDQFRLSDLHWINKSPQPGQLYRIRTRYRGDLVEGTVTLAGSSCIIKLTQPERAVTPGQSAVIYDGDKVIGGGIIQAEITKSTPQKAKSLVNSAK